MTGPSPANPAPETNTAPEQAAAPLTVTQQATLIRKLTALADDEIVLAHRDGEWTGHAPILEEDIALANIAQDELGHATLYLGLRSALDGSNPDRLAMFRSAKEYTNTRFVELPKGDWAYTMVRQFLYDAYEALWLEAATGSSYAPLAEVARKAVREEKFHLQHTALWVERLALGTEESQRRTQQALADLWPYAAQLFQTVEGEEELVAAGILPDIGTVKTRWDALTLRHLQEKCGLRMSREAFPGPSRENHTEHLAPMLATMQKVARQVPNAEVW